MVQLVRLTAAAKYVGSWSKPFNRPNLAKFTEPTVEGIDFPTLGVSAAHNLTDVGELHVSTDAATPSARRTPTTGRIANLPDPATVRIVCDGQEFGNWRVLDDSTVEVLVAATPVSAPPTARRPSVCGCCG